MTQTRQMEDEEGIRWVAFADQAVVAHGKQGAVLAFRTADAEPGDSIRSTITFNSMAAADFALRTMSDKELRRRLSLARMAVRGA